jgi:hypothetical protein
MFEIKTSNAAERKSLLYSLILSIIILSTGLAWAFRVGVKNLPAEHLLGHASDDLATLKKAQATHKSPKGSAK